MKVTIAQLIEAAKKNGYTWARDKFNHWEKEVYTCVVGQGILNLGGKKFPYGDRYSSVLLSAINEVEVYNDIKATSYEDAIIHMEKMLAPYLNEMVEI